MGDVTVNVLLVEGLALPYVEGAEAQLADDAFDPVLRQSWDDLLIQYPNLVLRPIFSLSAPQSIADLAAAIRMRGEEPPNLLDWFCVECDEALADAVLDAVWLLPFVQWAGISRERDDAGVVSRGTNPEAAASRQLEPPPVSVNAPYGWQVPGGTGDGIELADIERSWDLTHPDLADAFISQVHPQTDPGGAHGTAVLGVVAARDDGRGMIGIAPRVRVTIFPREYVSTAAAIAEAAVKVGHGGIILIETASRLVRPRPGPGADVPVEFDGPDRDAILVNTQLGITVIEPAGNAGVDMDVDARLAHVTRGQSGAIMVGEGEPTPANPNVLGRVHSTHGARVDCFALGDTVRAPSATRPPDHLTFTGTSAASAIIAGLAAQVQGIALAATGDFLDGREIRAMFRDEQLGTPSTPPKDGIGSMPDLKKICETRGWPAVTPPSLVAVTADSFDMSYLDGDFRFVRRRWSNFAGWQTMADVAGTSTVVLPQQPALTAGQGPAPNPGVSEAILHGRNGVRYMWWVDPAAPRSLRTVAPATTFAEGRSLSSVRSGADTLTVVGVNPDGLLSAVVGDLGDFLIGGFGPPTVIDTGRRYVAPSDPVACCRDAGFVDVIMVSDTGLLTWYLGSDIVGAPWLRTDYAADANRFVPTARPGVVASAAGLDIVALGEDGWMWSVRADPLTGALSAAEIVDTQVTLSEHGPLALARHGQRLIALAVDSDGVLRSAFRDAGQQWSELTPVDGASALSPFAGVSAVVMPAVGVAAVVVRRDSRPRWTLSPDGVTWSPPGRTEPEFPVL